MRREVLHKGWVHREWLLAHKVRWHSTGEYNGWLVFEHWQFVWETDDHGARGGSRKNVGWIVTEADMCVRLRSHSKSKEIARVDIV